MKGNKVKVILLVVLLVAVAAVFAVNLNLFGGRSSKPPAQQDPNTPAPAPGSHRTAPGAGK